MKKQLLSALLAGCLVVGCIGSVSAGNFVPEPEREDEIIDEITTAGGSATTPVTMTQEAIKFSATVPTSIPVYVDSDGNVTFPDSIDIVNNTVAPIRIENIAITGKNGWKKTDNTDGWKVNDYKFVMTLGYEGDKITNWTFAVAPRHSPINGQEIANVVFTVGWDTGSFSDSGGGN